MWRLEALRNRHRGERCVLMANGPSLNKMDMSLVRRDPLIGLNKIYLGFQRFGVYPRYYVAINPVVLAQAAPEIRALRCVKFLGSHAPAAGLAEDALTYLVDTEQVPARFSTDLCHGMHEGWTVTHAALQVAYHLGFAEVVIVGLDHRYRFEGQPNETHTLQGPDPNHFSEDYFGHGQRWDNPDLARSEESYRLARQAFEADGRRIIDATLDGACTIFEKADYRSVFAARRD
jgi:Protein of unknown function DUF115